MDKFNSLASQAKAKASEASAYAQKQYDARARSGSGSASHPSPAPSPPPGRPTSGAPVPPPGRGRAGSGLGPSSLGAKGGHVFVGMEGKEKEAFFGLLDEYFAQRPQYAGLFAGGAPAAPAPLSVAAPIAPTSRAGPPAPPSRGAGLGTATALYDFAGENPAEDLTFAEGDRITIVEHVSDDWWRGETRGHTGIFPSAYVQMN